MRAHRHLCLDCHSQPGEPCVSPAGLPIDHLHQARVISNSIDEQEPTVSDDRRRELGKELKDARKKQEEKGQTGRSG